MNEEIHLMPIGTVRNGSKRPERSEKTWRDRTDRVKAQRDSISEIIIDGVPEETLDGIEEYSHITIIYWPHLLDGNHRAETVKVHPLGNPDFPEVGVFATHSPARPNPVLITTVQLLERKGNVLKVTGLDALDGSPVLDIKPYIPDNRKMKNVSVADWIERLNQEFDGE